MKGCKQRRDRETENEGERYIEIVRVGAIERKKIILQCVSVCVCVFA